MHSKLFFVARFPLYPKNTGMNSQRHDNRRPHLWKKENTGYFKEMEQTEAKRGIAGVGCFATFALVSQTLKGL